MKYEQIVGRRYQLIKELGKNDWSRTYLAKDISIPNSSACVVQKFQLQAEEKVTPQDVRTRFANETYLWQKLAFEGQIPKVLACFEEDGIFYFVREYIPGQNLAQRLDEGGVLGEAELVQLLRDVLASLTLIHQQGILHRDLKPSNLIIRGRDRRVLVIGFGAIEAITNRPIARPKSTKLTPVVNEYYPVDQSIAQLGENSDIYALGAIAVEALTKKKPRQIPPHFPVKTVLARENCQINFKLVNIIERMMSLDATQTYTSAAEIIRELDNLKTIEPVGPVSPPLAEALNESQLQSQLLQPTGVSPPVDRPQYNSTPSYSSSNPWYWLAVPICLLFLAGVGEFFFPRVRPWYHCYQGSKLLSAEKPKEALDTFQQGIDLHGRSVCGWQGKGDALYGLERYRAALAAYDKVDLIKPNRWETWRGRGEALYRLERFEAANTAYNKALKLQPDNALIWNRKGRALYRLELYQEAFAAQDAALQLEPDYAQALNDRGIALIGVGQYEDALKAFNQAQVIEPLDPELWQNKALVLQYLNRPQEAMRLYQEALAAYDEVIEENPENITALLDKANVLSKLQRHQEALATYEQAIAVNEDSHLAWLGKGNALFAMRQYPESLAAFNRTVKVQPKSYISWHNRGSLLRDGLKNLPEAIASYDRSLEINPNFYHAWRDRGIALSQNQQHDQAIESFKKALSIKPNDYKSWVGRGIALSSLGKTEEAISLFERAVEIQPQDPFVWMNRGAALEKARRYTEACDAYRQVKKLNPGFSPAIAAMKRIGCRN